MKPETARPWPHDPAGRRRALQQLAWPAAMLVAPTLADASARRLTPAQAEGPFYPVSLPADTDFDLLRQGDKVYAQGQACWLSGTVTDPAGAPVQGAVVEIWQCDAHGHYRHPADGDRADPDFQSYGRVSVDVAGRYRFRTMRPAPYGGRTPHIHVKVRLGRRTLLTTQVYVAGDPGNARDMLWRGLRDAADRDALTLPFRPATDGLAAEFAIVVAV